MLSDKEREKIKAIYREAGLNPVVMPILNLKGNCRSSKVTHPKFKGLVK